MFHTPVIWMGGNLPWGPAFQLELNALALAQSPLPLKSQHALQPFLPSDVRTNGDIIMCEHIVKEIDPYLFPVN